MHDFFLCPLKEQHPKCNRTVTHFCWRKQSPGSEKCAFQYCPSTHTPDGHGQERPPYNPWHDSHRFNCYDAHPFHQNRDAAPWLCSGHPTKCLPPWAPWAGGGLRQEPQSRPVQFQHPASKLPEANTGLHLLRDFQRGRARGTKRGSCCVRVCMSWSGWRDPVPSLTILATWARNLSGNLGIEDFVRKVHKFNLVNKTFTTRNHYQKQMISLTSDRAFDLQSVEIGILIHSTGPGFARIQHSAVPLQVPKWSDYVCKLPFCWFLGVVCVSVENSRCI